jgi:hypothetical protein
MAVLSKNLNYTRRNMVTANEGSTPDVNALGFAGEFYQSGKLRQLVFRAVRSVEQRGSFPTSVFLHSLRPIPEG